MATYTCSFDRIGRNHDIPPLTVEADDADEIAFAVLNYARPRLLSSGVEVAADLDEGSGTIFCGFHVGGKFTIEAA